MHFLLWAAPEIRLDDPMTPHFMIVGAMKAGTTTLYHDLSRHPDLCLPELKEPVILLKFRDPDEARSAYAAHFRSARPGQLLGEASTSYTKRPTHEDSHLAARALCGPDLRIVYMRRDPIERIVSQYQHEKHHGLILEPFDEAVRRHPHLIAYSRYDWQIAPWVETFGNDNVLQLELDDYSRDRRGVLARVLRHIGADPERLPAIDEAAISNSGAEAKAIPNPLLRRLVYSSFYQRVLRERIPRPLRERTRRAILPAPEVAPVEVRPETRSFIIEQLSSHRVAA